MSYALCDPGKIHAGIVVSARWNAPGLLSNDLILIEEIPDQPHHAQKPFCPLQTVL
jgi:hypothetical protein